MGASRVPPPQGCRSQHSSGKPRDSPPARNMILNRQYCLLTALWRHYCLNGPNAQSASARWNRGTGTVASAGVPTSLVGADIFVLYCIHTIINVCIRAATPAQPMTLSPETVPARTIGFGRSDQEAQCQGSVQHRTDRHEAPSGRGRADARAPGLQDAGYQRADVLPLAEGVPAWGWTRPSG